MWTSAFQAFAKMGGSRFFKTTRLWVRERERERERERKREKERRARELELNVQRRKGKTACLSVIKTVFFHFCLQHILSSKEQDFAAESCARKTSFIWDVLLVAASCNCNCLTADWEESAASKLVTQCLCLRCPGIFLATEILSPDKSDTRNVSTSHTASFSRTPLHVHFLNLKEPEFHVHRVWLFQPARHITHCKQQVETPGISPLSKTWRSRSEDWTGLQFSRSKLVIMTFNCSVESGGWLRSAKLVHQMSSQQFVLSKSSCAPNPFSLRHLAGGWRTLFYCCGNQKFQLAILPCVRAVMRTFALNCCCHGWIFWSHALFPAISVSLLRCWCQMWNKMHCHPFCTNYFCPVLWFGQNPLILGSSSSFVKSFVWLRILTEVWSTMTLLPT